MFNIYKWKKRFDDNPLVVRIMPFVRGVLMYLVHAVMVGALMIWLDFYYDQATKPLLDYPLTVKTVFIMLMLYFLINTVILAYAIYNKSVREAFIEKHKMEYDPQEERNIILHSRDFWLELATLWGCFLLLPTLPGYSWILEPLTRFLSIHPILQKLILTLLFCAVTLHLSVKNALEARLFWLEFQRKSTLNHLWDSLDKKLARKYSPLRLFLRFFAYTLIYFAEIYLICRILPAGSSVLAILWMLVREGWTWFVPLVLLVPFVYYFRAFLKRRSFIKEVTRFCNAYRFELFDMEHPYRSLFREKQSYTFGIRTEKETYYCRILASVRASNQMTLYDDGRVTRAATVHAPINRMVRSGPFLQVYVRGEDEDTSLFHFTSTADYTFEAGDGKKILIINPVPRKVYYKHATQPRHEIDNGDTVGEYTLYTGNAFMRSLERKET